ncbi:MFS transporter [Nocardioides szechwanensis]|uniref:Predicted arabinose efflux permease, MFS family n=1 Tax=Nocardioides szechwanensis TaxID=1005944 RepID=A0A1H0BV80_9ACTN|nr:MFS transporter [Nocardioides szechwanensis]GEP33605.1 MFS transporter [Nocardioides szechwanensis]SDN49561.1 Predicted arabinose efflux permease, MFS family [Nocardioides szechwanensis]
MTLDAGALRRVVAVLCATEIVSWGVLFYAFTVAAVDISDTEGWPLTALVAVFTVAQLVGAATGVWVGRHIDAIGPRRVMTAGSALAVVAVVAISWAPTLATYAAAWVVAGAAMSATLYPPAFAAVTHWGGEHRVRALTAITLVAGFASTVFAPLTAWLLTVGDWRSAYLVLAAVLSLTVPLHWWGLRGPWTASVVVVDPSPDAAASPASAPEKVRLEGFVLLCLAMSLAGVSVYAVVVNLVPLLVEGGLTTSEAALALGIGGAGQVAGRLLYAPMARRLEVVARTRATLLFAGLLTVGLALVHQPLVLVAAISFAAGSARGVYTLLQATAVSDRWGTASYGARNGVLSGAVITASALSPWGGALLAAGLGSYQSAFLVLALVAVAAAGLVPRLPR